MHNGGRQNAPPTPYLKSGSRTLWVRLRRGRPSRPALRRVWVGIAPRSPRVRREVTDTIKYRPPHPRPPRRPYGP